MNKRSNESGRSMVEMIGVIAIIGVIAVGGITSMGYVDSYFRTSATLLEVEQLARDINDMYSWSSKFPEEDITSAVIDEEALDSERNRWGGNIKVEGNGVGFTITYTGVRKGACERIVEQALTLKEVELTYPTDIDACDSDGGVVDVVFSSPDYSDSED